MSAEPTPDEAALPPAVPVPLARVRVWDLPTRLFHWSLASLVIAAVVTAKIGGNAMLWHIRIGLTILALLAFRIVWGFVGGRWSRFGSFLFSPATSWRYLRGGSRVDEHHDVGHSPLGAWSVFALLAVLVVQVSTGLVADDEIATSGPLAAQVSTATSLAATRWHRTGGQWLILGLTALHLAAIAFYAIRRRDLVRPMWHGDKPLGPGVPAARDDLATRMLALAIAAACAMGAAALARFGG
jgi:cytochrome b